MKKIVPFNNVLTFDTDVKEITAISLEHKINTEENEVNGVFYITGEYKITDGQLEKEKFNFELPFDIALGSNYNLDTLVVDIDDFRYELVEENKLKVNIDLYIDGEVIEKDEVIQSSDETLKEDRVIEESKDKEIKKESINEPLLTKIQERLDILDEMISSVKKEEDNKNEEKELSEEVNIDINNDNDNNNEMIFNGFNEEEKYVTYRVYTVLENDTLDKVIEKYKTTKEELSKYNSLEDIHPGIKLIIPSNER